MKTVRNKTHRPLTIRLSRGRVLRLGPRKEGQIATGDAEQKSLKKLVANSDVEIFDEAPGWVSTADTHPGGRSKTQRQRQNYSVMKRGDR